MTPTATPNPSKEPSMPVTAAAPRLPQVNVADLFTPQVGGVPPGLGSSLGAALLLDLDGNTYNHPLAVRVNRGGEITEVTEEGTRLSAGPPVGRGVRIEVDLASEEGNCWTLALQFHKGQTFAEILPGPSLVATPIPDGRVLEWPRNVIWRD